MAPAPSRSAATPFVSKTTAPSFSQTLQTFAPHLLLANAMPESSPPSSFRPLGSRALAFGEAPGREARMSPRTWPHQSLLHPSRLRALGLPATPAGTLATGAGRRGCT